MNRTKFILDLESKSIEEIKQEIRDLEDLICICWSKTRDHDITRDQYDQVYKDLIQYKTERSIIADLYGF